MDANSAVHTVSDLVDGVADGRLLDEHGLLDRPVLIVDLDTAELSNVHAAVQRSADSPRILVGTSTRPYNENSLALAASFDVTYGVTASLPGRLPVSFVGSDDPYTSAGSFVEAVSTTPKAARVCAQVLKASEMLDVGAAIDVESFAYSSLLGGPEFDRWLSRRGPRPLPRPAEEPVRVVRTGDTLEIILDKPERRNAYGADVRDGLVDALEVVAYDHDITRVFVSATGPSFCAGGDLDEFGTTPDLVTAHFIRTRHGAARLMSAVAGRCEVRLHGSCIGAGIEIPAFASRVVADPGAMFRLPEVGMGLIPGAGGTVSIPRRIGRWRALDLFVTGRTMRADEALLWGLVDAIECVVPSRSLPQSQ